MFTFVKQGKKEECVENRVTAAGGQGCAANLYQHPVLRLHNLTQEV